MLKSELMEASGASVGVIRPSGIGPTALGPKPPAAHQLLPWPQHRSFMWSTAMASFSPGMEPTGTRSPSLSPLRQVSTRLRLRTVIRWLCSTPATASTSTIVPAPAYGPLLLTTVTASATEQGAACDPFYAPSSANCSAFYDSNEAYLCGVSGPDGGTEEDCTSSLTSGPISVKYGFATTGAKWLGPGNDGTQLGGGIYCDAGEYCTPSTTPPLCAVKSPVYINPFGQTGTPDQLCALHAAWAEEIPYGSFTFPSGTVLTFCSPLEDTAVPVGPTAPALNCTHATLTLTLLPPRELPSSRR